MHRVPSLPASAVSGCSHRVSLEWPAQWLCWVPQRVCVLGHLSWEAAWRARPWPSFCVSSLAQGGLVAGTW